MRNDNNERVKKTRLLIVCVILSFKNILVVLFCNLFDFCTAVDVFSIFSLFVFLSKRRVITTLNDDQLYDRKESFCSTHCVQLITQELLSIRIFDDFK